ncbi:DUF6011 domain-containing protein [Actinacidiphila rubida]|uniref:SWIM-type domain-containing protein n=1 Tax=Actinacidiphila rubida TaxID=310780 RepID=A0A1H8T0E3_9ACTN|nr:DUF6011 domain-containing protein [Actinacidiphila rubida]SEO84044.1 hypothetical protein SAMN05216267_104682 [Actinacidiphila rubida]
MATTEQTRCRHCHRILRSARSIALGYGPKCHGKIRKATAAQTGAHKPAAIEKARELIELGAITPLRGRRIFTVISSDGTSSYKTAAQGCTCPAGLKGRHVCYHRVAAQILTLAA